jgi:hypothetical protein
VNGLTAENLSVKERVAQMEQENRKMREALTDTKNEITEIREILKKMVADQ